MRGPMLAAPSVRLAIGYSSPVALGQRPKDSPLAPASKSTWSMKFNSLPVVGSADSSHTSSPCAALNEKSSGPGVCGVGLKSSSSKTR